MFIAMIRMHRVHDLRRCCELIANPHAADHR